MNDGWRTGSRLAGSSRAPRGCITDPWNLLGGDEAILLSCSARRPTTMCQPARQPMSSRAKRPRRQRIPKPIGPGGGHTLNSSRRPSRRRCKGIWGQTPPSKAPSSKRASIPNPCPIPIPIPFWIVIHLMRDIPPRRQSPPHAEKDTTGAPFRTRSSCWPPPGTLCILPHTPASLPLRD